jgi:hypothetical protein
MLAFAAPFLAAAAFVEPAPAAPVSTFVELPVPNRRDYAFDDAGVLYITAGPQIVRFDTHTGTYLAPFVLGGNLFGIDRSRDGRTLAVADETTQGSSTRIHLVRTETGAAQAVSFPQAFYESGTYMVAWGADDSILVTSSFAGSGWVPLRRYDPATGQTSVLASVRQDTMLTPSAGRETIGLVEANISSGPVHAYSVSQGAIVATVNTNWFTFEVAVAPDQVHFVVPTYGGAFVYARTGASFALVTTIGQYASHGPIAAVFSPTKRRLFTAEYGTNAGVKVYDVETWQELAVIDHYPFPWGGNGALGQGRMEVSADGTLLAVSVANGVRVYRVGAL